MDTQAHTPQVWFITGASKGFGLELVKQLLAQGHQVAATSRDATGLRAAVGSDSPNLLPLAVELTDEARVGEAIAATVQQYGRLDVVVNNAGYGQLGGLEEVTDAEARENFDVNVFGTLNVIRRAMPQLRKQQSGHIINFSSIAGIQGGFPGWGVYCATKFAVEGLSEALAAEVAPFGVKVTVVAPGYFRTNFLQSGSLKLAADKLPAYQVVRNNEAYHDHVRETNSQLGDPAKGAAALIQVATEPNPPMHLLLGADAYGLAEAKIKSLQADMATWQALSHATAADPAQA
ncbi:SDR family NAD(P)-dependent oxidoreductase [Hymenobacter cellulosilyticus]|uniref:SDR family NAD(P)-dependent oxidoreductase n=1 Tax=Hymenobacter cellulosilyticus TaxID=2932248 RepID=A0A8T9Q323_9BACT|nr:SDR family NAD(P)-dependent oxidoreductase [Hymenobacter cellulosilyticus]UOQ70180.1 SDR family NAD(P)-dependent oxidoreductase [Hymenobacter cellulosilyticus]